MIIINSKEKSISFDKLITKFKLCDHAAFITLIVEY